MVICIDYYYYYCRTRKFPFIAAYVFAWLSPTRRIESDFEHAHAQNPFISFVVGVIILVAVMAWYHSASFVSKPEVSASQRKCNMHFVRFNGRTVPGSLLNLSDRAASALSNDSFYCTLRSRPNRRAFRAPMTCVAHAHFPAKSTSVTPIRRVLRKKKQRREGTQPYFIQIRVFNTTCCVSSSKQNLINVAFGGGRAALVSCRAYTTIYNRYKLDSILLLISFCCAFFFLTSASASLTFFRSQVI